jgi:hypothetical protein
MAKMVSNQLTFLDMTDQKKLSIYLTSNLQTIQIRDSSKTVYNPSWTTTPLVIELQAFLDQNEILDYTTLSIQWYVKDGNNQEVEISGKTGRILTIAENALGESSSKMLTYICKVSYLEEESATSQLTYTLIDESEGVAGDSAVVFHVYAPNGTIFSNQSGTLEAKAIAYLGSIEITSGATYQWEAYVDGEYRQIDNAINNIYTISGFDVVNIMTYRCVMTYNDKTYVDVITFEDKSDTYVSEMLTIGGTIFKNGQGGSAVYVIVRSNGKEVDAFPDGCIIGTSGPLNPTEGMYWWKVSSGSAAFMKYNGTEWQETFDDTQNLDYIWTLMDKDGNVTEFYKTGKVIYLSCAEIDNIGTLQCDVKRKSYIGYNDGMVSIHEKSGMSATDDDNDNVEVTFTQTYMVTDDGNGNVTIT